MAIPADEIIPFNFKRTVQVIKSDNILTTIMCDQFGDTIMTDLDSENSLSEDVKSFVLGIYQKAILHDRERMTKYLGTEVSEDFLDDETVIVPEFNVNDIDVVEIDDEPEPKEKKKRPTSKRKEPKRTQKQRYPNTPRRWTVAQINEWAEERGFLLENERLYLELNKLSNITERLKNFAKLSNGSDVEYREIIGAIETFELKANKILNKK